MQAVVLAAGRGKRLRALTRGRPKPFLPLAGRSLLDRVVGMLRRASVDDLVLVLPPKAPALPASLACFRRVDTVVQSVPLGMADALACAAPFVRGDFLLCAADQLTAPDHVRALAARLQDEPGLAAVLSLLPAREEIEATGEPLEAILARSGVVAMEGERVLEIVEKPSPGEAPGDTISLPLYALRDDLLALLPQVGVSPRGEREVQTLFQQVLAAGRPLTGLLAPWRLTVNTGEQLLRVNLELLSQGEGVGVEGVLPEGVRVVPPVRVEAGAEVGAGCLLGPGVYLEDGARIGPGVVLQEVLVLQGGVVPPGVRLRRQVVGP